SHRSRREAASRTQGETLAKRKTTRCRADAPQFCFGRWRRHTDRACRRRAEENAAFMRCDIQRSSDPIAPGFGLKADTTDSSGCAAPKRRLAMFELSS